MFRILSAKTTKTFPSEITMKNILRAALLVCIVFCLSRAAQAKEIKAGGLTLQAPETWEAVQPSSSMRVAQANLPDGADLAVFFFGPQGGGGVEANVTRWVGQFEEAGRQVVRVKGTSPQGNFIHVTITGTYNAPVGPPMLRKTEAKPGSQVIAIIVQSKDGDYFLKCSGSEKAVSAASEDLLKSIGGTIDAN